jgi:hypothetical protein
MPGRQPPKPKTNLGKPLSNSAVRGLIRAMMSVKALPGRPAQFDAPITNRGPVRFFTPEQMLHLAARIEKLSAAGATKSERLATLPTARGAALSQPRPPSTDVHKQRGCSASDRHQIRHRHGRDCDHGGRDQRQA